MDDKYQWLLDSDEPWTVYRTRLDLLGLAEDEAEVQQAKKEMLAHANITGLMQKARSWPGSALKRHNDSKHTLYAISTLADFGFTTQDAGIADICQKVTAHQSEQGAFETYAFYPATFGGSNKDEWTWAACDAPTLLYALIAFGLGKDKRIQKAADHLVELTQENGWRCAACPSLGKFKGPGSRTDPCPIANVYALKALSLLPALHKSRAVENGIEMLLSHWGRQGKAKYFLFGSGSNFRKIKYPYVWYDILHIVEVLSRFAQTHSDGRMQSLLQALLEQGDEEQRFTSTSMYMAWKGWSFSDKKNPSPWLTFLVYRIAKRMQHSIVNTD